MIEIQLTDEWVKFIPTFRDNDECEEEEQISCLIKFIKRSDEDKLTDELIGSSRDGFRQKKGSTWSKGHRELVDKHVKDIKNIFVRNKEGARKEITTMEQLYRIPQYNKIYSEIAEALDGSNSLSECEVKNL